MKTDSAQRETADVTGANALDMAGRLSLRTVAIVPTSPTNRSIPHRMERRPRRHYGVRCFFDITAIPPVCFTEVFVRESCCDVTFA